MKNRLFQIKAKKRAGLCYQLAWHGLMAAADGEVVLIHGEIHGIDGGRIGHAWLAGTGEPFIYDPVRDEFFEPVEYYRRAGAVVFHVYQTKQEAALLALCMGVYGPWVPPL